MKLSLQERINCPASFCTDDNPGLLCSYDGACDGDLYECCFWEMKIGAYELNRRLEKEQVRMDKE